MIPHQQIEEIKNRLVKAYNPLAIYLFGSYAWGHPTTDSDLDLLVVIPDKAELKRPYGFKGHLALSDIQASKDLLVVRKWNFEKYADDAASLFYKIKKEAKCLYENI